MDPTSHFADGRLYAWVLDPLLDGLRGFVAKQVPEGAAVVEACCGTGSLALRLAARCASVVGVDLSPRMIAYAEAERARRGAANVRFRVGAAGRLDDLADASCDVGVVVLGLHEMPARRNVQCLEAALT